MAEEIPTGTDTNDLFTSQATEDIQIEYKGKLWPFTIRELTWRESEDCENAAVELKITGSKQNPKRNVQMNMNAYNTTYLQKAIVKAPFPLTPASFLRLDKKFGELLVAAVIKDGDVDTGESEEL